MKRTAMTRFPHLVGIAASALAAATLTIPAAAQSATDQSGDAPPVSNEQMAALGPIYPGVPNAKRQIVYHGYNCPSTDYFAKHWRSMDRLGLDGTGYFVNFPDPDNQRENLSGEYRTSMRLFDGQLRWQEDWFEQPLRHMRSAKLKNLTRNHLKAWVTPGDFSWFDDDAWANVLHNTRLLAEFGQATGNTAGILFDAEQYEAQPWHYRSLNTEDRRRSFADVAEQVRKRGASWAQTYGKAWPESEILLFWVSDYAAPTLGRYDDPARADISTGLFLAFFEGMLDTLPPTVTLVEGNEQAYMFGSPGSFPRNALRVRTNLADALTPSNRPKFRRAIRQSHGIYLDAHINPEGTQYGISRFGKTPGDLLYRNVLSALSSSDGMIWLWAEWGLFFDKEPTGYAYTRIPEERRKLWSELIPGLFDAFTWAKAPHAQIEKHLPQIERVFADRGLIGAADMQPQNTDGGAADGVGWDTGDLPGGWWSWKEDDDPGSFAYDRKVGREAKRADRASLRADGITDGGCFGFSVPVTPQRTVLIVAHAKVQGDAIPLLIARWRHPGEAFDMAGEDVRAAFGQPDRDGWRRAMLVVTAMEQVSSVVPLLSVSGDPNATVWFDDVQVYDFTDGPARLWD